MKLENKLKLNILVSLEIKNRRKKVETILYKCLKRMIEKGNYENIEAMAEKISILYANDQLTADQYQELMAMLGEA